MYYTYYSIDINICRLQNDYITVENTVAESKELTKRPCWRHKPLKET